VEDGNGYEIVGMWKKNISPSTYCICSVDVMETEESDGLWATGYESRGGCSIGSGTNGRTI